MNLNLANSLQSLLNLLNEKQALQQGSDFGEYRTKRNELEKNKPNFVVSQMANPFAAPHLRQYDMAHLSKFFLMSTVIKTVSVLAVVAGVFLIAFAFAEIMFMPQATTEPGTGSIVALIALGIFIAIVGIITLVIGHEIKSKNIRRYFNTHHDERFRAYMKDLKHYELQEEELTKTYAAVLEPLAEIEQKIQELVSTLEEPLPEQLLRPESVARMIEGLHSEAENLNTLRDMMEYVL